MKIVLENVSKSYGTRTVVKDANLSVSQGEIVGLLGPNGAGKTTLFYTITGLIAPNYGQVWLDKRNITPLPIDRRAKLGISYLPQEPSIFRQLTVRENLLLVLEQTKVPRRQWSQRLHDLLDEFRLHQVASTPGIRVSGGERRRTEIARSLAVGRWGPKFLLLDEPFAGIDPIAVSEIQTIIARLRTYPMGILITDHNVRETLEITDRAYIMREGEIFASGTATELYNDPLVRKYYLGKNFQF